MNLSYSILIIAKLQAFANALICHECKNCQSGFDEICGEKHNFKVCKCEKDEPGELKSCENTEGQHASCVTVYDANGTQIINRYCQVMASCLIPKPEVKCVSSIMKN